MKVGVKFRTGRIRIRLYSSPPQREGAEKGIPGFRNQGAPSDPAALARHLTGI